MNRLRSRALSRRTEEAPVDPMSSIGNLADAMLVLAVGIMLALILNASASTVGTGIIGLFSASPKPFAVAEPILSPVNEPGPAATAIASIVDRSSSTMLRTSSIMGTNVCE